MSENSQVLSVIDQIVQKYIGNGPILSKRDQNKAKWTSSPDKSQNTTHTDKIAMDFDTANTAVMHIATTLLRNKGSEFYMSQENLSKYENMLKAIIHDVTSKYNHHKGIYLYGLYSTGKTWIMNQICRMMTQAHYTTWYTNTPIPIFISYKTDIMMRARAEKDISFISTMFKNKPLIFIDDIGYEDDSQLILFGNRENVIIHLVDILYSEYQKGSIIHFTSNLQLKHPNTDMPSIFKKYGQGTHDRLYEMCTPVLWATDKNLRTIKQNQ